MEGWNLIIALAIATGAVWLTLFPLRWPQSWMPRIRKPRHWGGAPDLREGEE